MRLLLLTIFLCININSFATTLETHVGLVRGQEDKEVTIFKNIPYALPPLGKLRWKAPRKQTYSHHIINKQDKLIRCAQLGNFFSGKGKEEFNRPIGSEDCLYLNIWKPRNFKKNLPIFFWIHGGSNKYGFAGDEAYDGRQIAKLTNSIVVTVNYRLGYFGALYHSKLRNGDAKDSSGNYTTLDLIAALQWIRKNAEIFGGDKNNITIAGQSAGCINVWGLIQSPLAKDKFHKAYCASGLPNSYPKTIAKNLANKFIDHALVLTRKAQSHSYATQLRKQLSAKEVQNILYSLSTEEILSIPFGKFPIQHIADGHVLPLLGLTNFTYGNFNKVPMILGQNKKEASYFLQFEYTKLSQEDFWDIMNGRMSPKSFYDVITGTEKEKFDFNSYNITRGLYHSNTIFYQALKVFSTHIYRYQFSWASSYSPWKEFYGATHGIDIPILFNRFHFTRDHVLNFLSEDFKDSRIKELSQRYLAYLKGFLHVNNPNTYKLSQTPKWEQWSQPLSSPILIFDNDNEYIK